MSKRSYSAQEVRNILLEDFDSDDSEASTVDSDEGEEDYQPSPVSTDSSEAEEDVNGQSEPERLEAVEPVLNNAANIGGRGRGRARGRGGARGISCGRAGSRGRRPVTNIHSSSPGTTETSGSSESIVAIKRWNNFMAETSRQASNRTTKSRKCHAQCSRSNQVCYQKC
jgi:hypothetical protein